MSNDVLRLAGSVAFIDEMYERYRRDPAGVDPSWRALFDSGRLPPPPTNGVGLATPPSFVTPHAEAGPPMPSMWPLVNAYRVRGHLEAGLDPLGLTDRPEHPELQELTYGITEREMDRACDAGGLYGIEEPTPRAVRQRLRETYCRSIGLEFMHIAIPSRKQWLARAMETRRERYPVDAATRVAMLEALIRSEAFEHFVHAKYPGTKRFSLQGGESLIPVLELLLERAAQRDVAEAVLGMAHRGRLCVLHEILKKPTRDLFMEFDDIEPEVALGGGDVKYHLGFSCDRVDRHGRAIHLSLTFNPSHLEAVNPVVVGRVRAKQHRLRDPDHRRALGILIHGDAAFAGQGSVPETLNLSNLHGYKTGGTVHIVVNNQIGFTATPIESRSTPYCTDVAKMIQCPIFHVNGEDLDAVAQVCDIAMEYRDHFQSDVVIDMFCYRKYGHNEMDEPSFTQPQMYRRIEEKQPVAELYGRRLVRDGVMSEAEVAATRERLRTRFEEELAEARASTRRPVISSMAGVWQDYLGGADEQVPDVDTGVSHEQLVRVAEAVARVPDGFKLHRKIERLYEQRRAMGGGEQPLDWAMAEQLALGSLLLEGTDLRFTGQDTSRGTFSQRHAVVTDQRDGSEYTPLAHMSEQQGTCCIYDSPLSEAGVVGFEFGYSLDSPGSLVMWEAQFGDFVNGAQVHLDVFVCACEDKWKRLSGLVLLLPHGFEGQGPEHSSARLERFLENCAEDNWQICQPSTPAQYFHLLRRQVLRKLRKPLVVIAPKSLLRLPAARSSLDELASGRFARVLQDEAPPEPAGVERVLLCSGRVYYDLIEERAARGDRAAAIVRLEQLYPWRAGEIAEAVAAYGAARELVWVQDEPANMGAWRFVEPRLRELFPQHALRAATRDESASPATGSHKAHIIEQQRLLERAFGGPNNG